MTSLRPSVRARRAATWAAAVAVSITTVLATTAGPAAAAPVPTDPVALPTAIEVMPPYQPQTFCDPTTKPGVTALADLLTSTYHGTTVVSTARPCGSDTSEHYDGRALDWGVDHRNDRQRRQGKALLAWLFAKDAAGNSYAMVRRLGIMYVIWNKRIWGAWNQQWEPYSCSGVTACHVDHMHFSLDWSGAMEKTSFWTGTVRPPMDPPLIAIKTLHDPRRVTMPLHDSDGTTVYRAVAGGRYRIRVAGTYNDDGQTHHRADGECSTTDGEHWTKLAAGETSGSTGRLDLWVAGHHAWRPKDPTGGGCAGSTHVYRRVVTFDQSTPLTMSIADPDRWSGDGSLRVTVVRIG